MTTDLMQKFLKTSALNAGSMSYLEELYETYLANPNAVEAHWRQYFDQLPAVVGAARETAHLPIQQKMLAISQQKGARVPVIATVGIEHERNQTKVLKLIESFRARGHLQANLDPLNLTNHPSVPELTLAFHDLHERDLDTVFDADQVGGLEQAPLRDIYAKLKEIYCGSIGAEYLYLSDIRQQEWIRQRLEEQDRKHFFTPNLRKRIFDRLNAADELETYLHTRFVGQKRFSLEGGDALIPFVDEVIQRGGMQGVKEMNIGMAHRGRLNVLVNILGKTPSELFSEFEGKHDHHNLISGDVKYHQGFASTVRTSAGNVHLALAFNPSHLEIVAPVVEGAVRARQERSHDAKGTHVLPLVIHGDAAFAGQGVVMETFCMSQTRGYKTGGTIHVVVNNQVGFTTSNPEDSRSTLYCTDVAKMVEAPVFHVNADDAESVVFLAQLALDYRMAFGRDIVIDLVCYRRHGHNEADEPSATQPIMYQVIKQHETPAALYAKKLVAENVMTEAEVKAVQDNYIKALDKGDAVAADLVSNVPSPYQVHWEPYLDHHWTEKASTALPVSELKKLAEKLTQFPENFKLQPQVAKMLEQRQKMATGEVPADWGFAENLAYATLLQEYPVRISGQDCGRGTFSHRHAVFYDQNTGNAYIPLQHIAEKQAKFTVIDSILSEEAVLAFEYGYSTAEPNGLDIWEAQFGDFANGAQVVIDQFISSGEAKWGRLCGITLLLPHGYEGQGPEHSSARLERYLQLCADDNMQVCVPTTPAQVYHMLRRQMVRPYRKPLIVMSPKSLLRHKLAVSGLQELAEGHFQNVIPEVDALKADKVRKVVFCSGKVYYDLLTKRREQNLQDIAVVRVEQLYPFPEKEVAAELKTYSKAKEIVWCQEEPQNQGSWTFIAPYLSSLLSGQKLTYAGRKASASPAVGYLSDHVKEQAKLVEDAFK